MKLINKILSLNNAGTKDVKCLDIYIHIGSPKAGSSALQSFLLNSRKSLEKVGYFYPEHGIDKNNVSGGHGKLSTALNNKDLKEAEVILSNWLLQAKRKNKSLLLSSEAFYNQANSFHELLNKTDFLGLYRINVIAFVPAPINYLVGNYNQGVKRHYETRKFSKFLSIALKNSNKGVSGRPLFEWADAFSDKQCRFLNYLNPRLSTERIEEIFLRELNVPDSDIESLLPRRTIINRSYVRSALELKRILNIVLVNLPSLTGRDIDSALQKYSDLHPDEDILSSGNIPAVQYTVINKVLLEAMNPVLERFTDLDRNILFPIQQVHDLSAEKLISLYHPLAYLNANYPKEMEGVKREALSQQREGREDYLFLKLLDLLGIDFDEEICHDGLSTRARAIISSGKKTEADRLRELGIYFEEQGLLDDALLLLSKALELRPKGGGIKKRYHQILSKKSVIREVISSDPGNV